jgi:copper(I)-binding protein
MSMLHQTTVDDKGVARMRMVMALDVPAGQTVSFAPGGYHIMLMNIARDVYPGDAIPLTLTFVDKGGKSFDLPVGALALDAPPEDDTLIVANTVAQPDPLEENALDVSLVLDNRGDQADMLTGAVSMEGAPALLTYLPGPRVSPYTSVEIAAQAQTPLVAPDGIFIRLSNLTRKDGGAFALTLTFESGKSLTVAVPVVGAAS